MAISYSPRYSKHSLYYNTPIVKKFMGYYIHRPIPPHYLDFMFKINSSRYVHRPDLLALDFYNDDRLLWVIPVRNAFQDLYFDLKLNREVIVPHPSYINEIL